MKLNLINKLTHQVIYAVDIDGTVTINDNYLRNAMQQSGVSIPFKDQQDPTSPFFGKAFVKLNDKDFHLAFYKYFWPRMNLNEFSWQNSSFKKLKFVEKAKFLF